MDRFRLRRRPPSTGTSRLWLLEEVCAHPLRSSGVGYGLLRSYVKGRALVPWDEILDFLASWEWSQQERAGGVEAGFDMRSWDASMLDSGVSELRGHRSRG